MSWNTAPDLLSRIPRAAPSHSPVSRDAGCKTDHRCFEGEQSDGSDKSKKKRVERNEEQGNGEPWEELRMQSVQEGPDS